MIADILEALCVLALEVLFFIARVVWWVIEHFLAAIKQAIFPHPDYDRWRLF